MVIEIKELSPEELKVYKKAFRKMDLKGDGVIHFDEFCMALYRLGYPLRKDSAKRKMFDEIDLDGTGKISLDEFLMYVKKRRNEFYEVYQQIAKIYDQNNQFIRLQDLKKFTSQLGLELSNKQLRNLINQMDQNKDGMIGFDEFHAYFAIIPYPINCEAVFDVFYTNHMIDEWGDGGFFMETDLEDLDPAHIVAKFIGGALAGAVARTVTSPIEIVKMTQQTQDIGSKYLGFMYTAKKIYNEGGPRFFFRGNLANILKVAPESSIRMFLFDHLRDHFAEDRHNVTMIERFLCGGFAAFFAETAVYPLEVAKTKISLSKLKVYGGIIDCLADSYRRGGIKGVYAGLSISQLSVFPMFGTFLTFNSKFREIISDYLQNQDQEPSPAVIIGCASLATIISVSVVSPLNIIKTRLQANYIESVTDRFKGPLDVAQQIWKGDGMRGFYRGLGTSMLKIIPTNCTSQLIWGILQYRFFPRNKDL